MASIVVRELDVMAAASWSFRDSTPTWRHRRWGSAGVFDPFPAYRHGTDVVRDTAAQVELLCPPLWEVELFVADREETGRTNGYSNVHQDSHQGPDGWVADPPVGLIMLSGKRIPPHPAMSRYLVGHEYGHHVQWMLNHLRHPDDALQGDQILTDYAAVRGLPTPVHHGSGGRWHDSAAEVFACDFRTIVCGIEAEFWPHPGVPQPRRQRVLGRQSVLEGWWDTAVRDLTRAATTPTTAATAGH